MEVSVSSSADTLNNNAESVISYTSDTAQQNHTSTVLLSESPSDVTAQTSVIQPLHSTLNISQDTDANQTQGNDHSSNATDSNTSGNADLVGETSTNVNEESPNHGSAPSESTFSSESENTVIENNSSSSAGASNEPSEPRTPDPSEGNNVIPMWRAGQRNSHLNRFAAASASSGNMQETPDPERSPKRIFTRADSYSGTK